MRARWILLLALVVGLLAPAAPAGAHADLVWSCPGAGDRLREISAIELTFSERILDDGEAKVDLIDISGEEFYDVGPVEFIDTGLTLRVEVLETLDAGFYVVRAMGTSVDGDANGADLGFQFEIDPDRSPDSDTCDLPPEENAAGWVLMALGVVALLVVVFFLRPTGASDDTEEPEPQV